MLHKYFRLNLFWKIFFWFLLATLTTLLSVVFLYSFTAKDSNLIAITAERNQHLREQAIELQLSHNIQELSNPASTNSQIRRKYANVYLLDPSGGEISHREVPEAVYQLRSYYKKHRLPATMIIDNYAYSGPEVVFNRGEHYFLFTKQEGDQHFKAVLSSLFMSISLAHISAALLISAIVCLLLTWYITRPIHQLQQLTRAFSTGDLTIRSNSVLRQRKDEFSALAGDFDQMAIHLDRMLQSQKRLLSDVSHELRSPLTRIQIATSLAEKTANQQQAPYLERIEIEVSRLDQLIAQLLQVASLERGHLVESLSVFSLNELLNELVHDAQFEAQARNKKVFLQLPEETVEFQGYYQLLERSIENIVRNAIRHTPEKSIVTIILHKEKHNAIIRVQDEGEGISAEHLTKIFKPFYRPTDARERSSGGAGLGLTIAKQGVTVNNGIIKAENRMDHQSSEESNETIGLEVSISLPLKVLS